MKKESMRMKKDIRAYEYEELQKELERLGEKPFRAKQIYEWLHVKLADRFDEMTNLSVRAAAVETGRNEQVFVPSV